MRRRTNNPTLANSIEQRTWYGDTSVIPAHYQGFPAPTESAPSKETGGTMKLWLLRPILAAAEDWPWAFVYDTAQGFVVRAESEREARQIADANAGKENEFPRKCKPRNPWLDEHLSSCIELLPDGPRGVVITDFLYS